MLRLLLPLLITATALADEGRKPTDDEIRRAHELFAGTWDFVSLTDDGEELGPRMIATKLAKDGRLEVGDRKMAVVSPETGARREARFLLDPSKNPRRIDLIAKNDRLIPGIYQFQDENLVICIQTHEDGARPDGFSAPEGSGRMLARLKLSEPPPPAAATGPKRDVQPVSRTVAEATAPRGENAPTEAELRRAHETLAGAWDILSIVDDGEELGPNLVRAKFAEDGRLRIGERTLTLVSPKTDEKRVAAFHIDPSKSPREIDVTTHFDESLKGIYKFSGDQLWLCVAKGHEDDRPTDFDASSGTDRTLFHLRMARSELPLAPPHVSPAEQALQRDQEIRRKLVGSWSSVDTKGLLTIVLRSDGTFVATRTWAKGLKRLFEGDTTSQGVWSYQGGVLRASITSTEAFNLLGRSYSGWLQSIGDDTLVLKNIFGELRTAQRLR